ncbi:DNA excision repair protein ERCC-2 [Galdieria sulphuraria]|uniref:DNA excision repair protein ERCC-2 n=1 Tax=Galdieria sulphuraria TaxID=130081 RepID=M2Y0K1_GALSU|nr:DNA excision repair protein ERCC-2 [Galdieria sulphuraria]EME29448.1 DNA excision repair protein ERCC-2 [Galdieria sulphuraria]|eukprot:XP_005705968.1 DNA excision repair protein ERCC-2 [Galdieria sulphuraria]
MNVIETGTIGILESPTGTGKSLSIVCGVLTWLRQYYERNGIEKEKGTNEETDEPAWVTEFEDSLKKNQTEKAVERFARRRSLRQHRTLLNRVERSKTILETSSNKKHKRSHSGNFQDNKLVGADPDDEWLLSDTVFKDTSILSSEKEQLLTLGSGNEEMSEEEDECKELPRIYYCSRTHSQLLQFQEEVKRTIANMQWSEKVPRPSVLILSSRKNLCINEKVSSLSNANLINERCMELTSKEPGSPGCCPYYHLEGQRILRDHLSSEIVDIEELVNLGKERRACPYYGMKRAIKSSQFILLPYQSLLHKPTRESLRLPLHSNCIVIFDEAHHVVDALNDMYGAETNTQQIQSCLFGLKRYIDCYETRLSSLNLFMLRQFHSFLESLVQFSSLHLKIPPIDGETQNVFTVEDFVTRLGIDNLNIFKLNEFLESKCLHLKLIGLLKSRILSDSNGTDPCQGIHAVFHFVQTLKQPYSKSRIIVKFRKDIGCTFKMLVLHAANNLTEIISLVRSVVFVGGTLEPLRDIKLRLLGTFEDSHIVHCSFDHVIPDSHILPIIVSRGPTRVPLEFTYATRESEILIHELGRMLLNICRVVPGGVVVFFSSYSYCSYALNYLQQKDIWKLLLRQKAIFKEPQESLELNNVLDNYKKAVYEQQGGILFAVIGGKLSEGINFQDDLGRCIIVVGMPFPNHLSIELQESINYITGMFPSVSSKEILEDMCMKLVNQTIGRTIRHISDYGAVLLVDQRFARPAISNKLPKWLRRRLAFPDDFGWVLSSLAEFFRNFRKRV